MQELNDYETLTLMALAKDIVGYFDLHSGQCGYCLWVPRDWQPVHKCLMTEIEAIVKSWEDDGTLADD